MTSTLPVEILERYWGYTSFRPLQEDIINSVLAGKDTLGLMPTGGGKSLTFQVPGMMFETGVTVVVTPLVSLMKDQVDNLKTRGIRAVYLHSGMKPSETRSAWEKLVNGKARFLYISPERLQNERFMAELRNIEVKLIVVDEAHCISQWGYDFRPSYLGISKLRVLKPEVPVLALTATATPFVADDICSKLRFSENNIFRKSFVRDNISYVVRATESKIHEILHILSRTSGSAIVYVRSRKRCRDISEYLCSADIPSTFYHAGLEFKEKEKRQNEWSSGEVRVIVATNAFGMGIDKPDVRVVIHFDTPPSLEEYYQEAGRAGRDGLPSFAVMLVSKDDIPLLRRRVSENFPPRDVVKKTYERICIFLHLSVGEGFDSVCQFDIKKFCSAFKLQEKQVRASIRLLSQAGYIHFIEETDSRSRLRILCRREDLYDIHDLGLMVENVLSMSMRIYTGLFSDYVYLLESELSERLKISEKEVYESMLVLSKRKIVSYIPKSSIPMIYFPTAREETSSLLIGKDIYEARRKIMSQRTESVVDYAFSADGCRVKKMLGYFGEDNTGNCGKCDRCREERTESKKAFNTKDLVESILETISGRPEGISLSLLENGLGFPSEHIRNAISALCREGIVKYKNSMYSIEENT